VVVLSVRGVPARIAAPAKSTILVPSFFAAGSILQADSDLDDEDNDDPGAQKPSASPLGNHFSTAHLAEPSWAKEQIIYRVFSCLSIHCLRI
jgi:hypothetical protein